MYEFARGNYKNALELLGSEFNATGYKVKQISSNQLKTFMDQTPFNGSLWTV